MSPWWEMLIDDRVPPFRPPERPVWEPDWRLWGWVAAALGVTAAALATSGFASFVLVCAAIGFAARAVTHALPYGEGLREHRQ